MKSWKRTLFIILAIVIVLSLVLSACGLLDRSGNKGDIIPAPEDGCPAE